MHMWLVSWGSIQRLIVSFALNGSFVNAVERREYILFSDINLTFSFTRVTCSTTRFSVGHTNRRRDVKSKENI